MIPGWRPGRSEGFADAISLILIFHMHRYPIVLA